MTRPWALALFGLLAAGPVLAQSLAEMAAKEKERRKKAGSAAQTFTDQDLKKARGSSGPATAESPAASQARRASGGSLGDNDPPSDGGSANPSGEEGWRTGAAELRDAVAQAEKGVAEAQKKVDAARSSVGQPQPSDGLRQTPVNPLIREPGYEAAEKELADARAAVDVARAALAAYEEKARKAGVPPGWLR